MVRINAMVKPRVRSRGLRGQVSPFGIPLDDFFFNEPEADSRQRPGSKEEELMQAGVGSGVIVSNDGYILSNNHVVQDADELDVQLSDGRK